MEAKLSPLFIAGAFWQTCLQCAEIRGFQTLQFRIRQTNTARGRAQEGAGGGRLVIPRGDVPLTDSIEEGGCVLLPAGPKQKAGMVQGKLTTCLSHPSPGRESEGKPVVLFM